MIKTYRQKLPSSVDKTPSLPTVLWLLQYTWPSWTAIVEKLNLNNLFCLSFRRHFAPAIISENELKNLDSLIKENEECGWAVETSIDYTEKLNFSDNEEDDSAKEKLADSEPTKKDTKQSTSIESVPKQPQPKVEEEKHDQGTDKKLDSSICDYSNKQNEVSHILFKCLVFI